MQWNEGHTWTLDVQLPVGAVNFKIVMHDQPNSHVRWEMGDDRSVLIPETTTVTGAPVGQVGCGQDVYVRLRYLCRGVHAIPCSQELHVSRSTQQRRQGCELLGPALDKGKDGVKCRRAQTERNSLYLCTYDEGWLAAVVWWTPLMLVCTEQLLIVLTGEGLHVDQHRPKQLCELFGQCLKHDRHHHARLRLTPVLCHAVPRCGGAGGRDV